jgi:hypothetical protein
MTDVATAASHAPTSVSVPAEPPSSFDHFYEIVVAFRDAHPDANGNLSVAPFLEAMNKFLRIVDALGTPALGEMVKKDVSANITVRATPPPLSCTPRTTPTPLLNVLCAL